MRRRAVMRRGPGVVGTVARTAVVAGTAAVTVGAVSGHQQKKAAAQQAAAQQEMAEQQAAVQTQQDLEQMKAQMEQMQAQQTQAAVAPQAPAAPPTGGDDPIAKLQKLNDLKQAGALTDEEFQVAKTKILGL